MSGLLAGSAPAARAQELRDLDRERAQQMLRVVRKNLEKHYYDPAFHGMDLDTRFNAAREALETATSLDQAFGIIAQTLLDLNDSHTRFLPPERTIQVEYGLKMRMIGDTAHVIGVKPKSDAEAKGLKAGDAILSINDIRPTRENMPVLIYRYYTVRPEPGLNLIVQSPGGQPRRLDILAKLKREKRLVDLTQGDDVWDRIRKGENAREEHLTFETRDKKLIIWHMPSFSADEDALDKLAGKLHRFETLILDLRGNAGGYIKTLRWLLGLVCPRDVTVGQPKGRKEKMEPIVAKSAGFKGFKGLLVVLVDSESASSAELFARVIQLEKRGTVLGDRSAGAVMQSRYHPLKLGADAVIPYGVNISEADIVMSDGKSLERVGVTPDELVLPTGADLAANRDPVLTRAAALVGVNLPPEQAGEMFPLKWD
jgi:carboxyl-terminal processing protease